MGIICHLQVMIVNFIQSSFLVWLVNIVLSSRNFFSHPPATKIHTVEKKFCSSFSEDSSFYTSSSYSSYFSSLLYLWNFVLNTERVNKVIHYVAFTEFPSSHWILYIAFFTVHDLNCNISIVFFTFYSTQCIHYIAFITMHYIHYITLHALNCIH